MQYYATCTYTHQYNFYYNLALYEWIIDWKYKNDNHNHTHNKPVIDILLWSHCDTVANNVLLHLHLIRREVGKIDMAGFVYRHVYKQTQKHCYFYMLMCIFHQDESY